MNGVGQKQQDDKEALVDETQEQIAQEKLKIESKKKARHADGEGVESEYLDRG